MWHKKGSFNLCLWIRKEWRVDCGALKPTKRAGFSRADRCLAASICHIFWAKPTLILGLFQFDWYSCAVFCLALAKFRNSLCTANYVQFSKHQKKNYYVSKPENEREGRKQNRECGIYRHSSKCRVSTSISIGVRWLSNESRYGYRSMANITSVSFQSI